MTGLNICDVRCPALHPGRTYIQDAFSDGAAPPHKILRPKSSKKIQKQRAIDTSDADEERSARLAHGRIVSFEKISIF